MKILTVTILLVEERGEDSLMETASYMTLEDCAESILKGFDNCLELDLVDADEPEDTREVYADIKADFEKWWPEIADAEDDFQWWSEDQGLLYLFNWVELIG